MSFVYELQGNHYVMLSSCSLILQSYREAKRSRLRKAQSSVLQFLVLYNVYSWPPAPVIL